MSRDFNELMCFEAGEETYNPLDAFEPTQKESEEAQFELAKLKREFVSDLALRWFTAEDVNNWSIEEWWEFEERLGI